MTTDITWPEIRTPMDDVKIEFEPIIGSPMCVAVAALTPGDLG